MKIALTSDIHLEFGDWYPVNPENADVLILGGDIMLANEVETALGDTNQIIEYKGHRFIEFLHNCKKEYDWAISKGIAKEQARKVLPEGITKTRLYMNGTLRSWIHYIELRSANGTQKEHMAIAIACAEMIAKIFPLMKEL